MVSSSETPSPAPDTWRASFQEAALKERGSQQDPGELPEPSKPVVNKKAAKREAAKAKILNATLNLIAEQGLAALSHRTIAKAADVQLAMTTYYFQTFDNLVHAAFQRFQERMLPLLTALDERQQLLLAECVNDSGELVERERYIVGLSDLFTAFFDSGDETRRRQLKVESQFLFEQFLPEPVAEEVLAYTASLRAISRRCCAPFNSGCTALDADLLLTVVQFVEFSRASSMGFEAANNRPMVLRLLNGIQHESRRQAERVE